MIENTYTRHRAKRCQWSTTKRWSTFLNLYCDARTKLRNFFNIQENHKLSPKFESPIGLPYINCLISARTSFCSTSSSTRLLFRLSILFANYMTKDSFFFELLDLNFEPWQALTLPPYLLKFLITNPVQHYFRQCSSFSRFIAAPWIWKLFKSP